MCFAPFADERLITTETQSPFGENKDTANLYFVSLAQSDVGLPEENQFERGVTCGIIIIACVSNVSLAG